MDRVRLSMRSVYKDPGEATKALYALLQSRVQNLEMNISHQAMPSMREHALFVRSRPYRIWYLIRHNGLIAGTIYATTLNEIGIHLFQDYRGRGIAKWALEQLIARHKPLPAVPARRIGAWLANINPKNLRSIDFFEKAGFELKAYTFQRGGVHAGKADGNPAPRD